MPRRTPAPWSPMVSPCHDLALRLAEELRDEREFGQPFVYEQDFRTGKRRVIVLWDEWKSLSPAERSATIYRADELALGPAARDEIALASGYTIPEALSGGLLGFRILPAVRPGDPLTLEQANQALLEEGASNLFSAGLIQLRFATSSEAQASLARLTRKFPHTENVWLICEAPRFLNPPNERRTGINRFPVRPV